MNLRQRAISCAPRGQRFQWLLKVQAPGAFFFLLCFYCRCILRDFGKDFGKCDQQLQFFRTLVHTYREILSGCDFLGLHLAGGNTIHLASVLGHSEWKPRCSRGATLLFFDLEMRTESFSLPWSSIVSHCLSEAIIQDLLVFRADRERYYYGLELSVAVCWVRCC